jgi:hypothetical protein
VTVSRARARARVRVRVRVRAWVLVGVRSEGADLGYVYHW